MLEQPQAGLIGRFYRQVENRPKKRSKESIGQKKEEEKVGTIIR